MTKTKFDHQAIEKKYQKMWEAEGIYTPEYKKKRSKSRKTSSRDKPFFNLWMFPYPSAEGLHAGHAFSSTGDDVIGRFMRMNGKNTYVIEHSVLWFNSREFL